MNTAELSPERLAEIVARFPTCRIGILGDFFLDKYLELDTTIEEISLETGLPAHQVADIRCCPGAAGTVTANLAALGAGELHAIGFTGEDGEGYDLRAGLERLGCSTVHLQSLANRFTPTYLKPRNAGDPSLKAEHSRYDTKNRRETGRAVEEALIASIDGILGEVDALVVMDQVEENNCGVVTERVRAFLAERAKSAQDTIFWADSRRRIHDFRHLIVKPNQFEAVRIDHPGQVDRVDLEELRSAAAHIQDRNAAPVVITRGSQGMVVSHPKWTVVPGVRITGEVDPTGAGDSVTAGMVLSLCAGASLAEAGVIGNLVASITVRHIGQTGVAKPEELPSALELWKQQKP